MSEVEPSRMPEEREQVVALLRAREPELREFGIAGLSLFGSMARGEAGSGSDVDVLLDVGSDARLGLGFLEFVERLGDEIGRPVDFAFPDALRPWLRRQVEAETIRVF